MHTRTSLADVARAAGVSKTVVSAVVNNRVNQGVYVGEAKHQVILDLVKRMNYIPQKSARALIHRRTDALAVIAHSLQPYFAELIEEIHRQAQQRKLDILPFFTGGSGAVEEHYLELLRDGRADGILSTAWADGSPERYRRFAAAPHALRIVAMGPPIEGIPIVHFDEKAGGELAATHLIEQGCRRLGVLTVSAQDLRRRPTTSRSQAFLKAARKAGLPCAPITASRLASPGPEDGEEVLAQWLGLDPRPDGLFAYNDSMAFVLLEGLQRRGVRVPDDVAVIGCDNVRLCDCVYPRLTSLDTHRRQAVTLALDRLRELIDGQPVRVNDMAVPVDLVVRESTRRPGREER